MISRQQRILEMDEHLGYSSYERSDNTDYRNGKKTKKIRGNFGETEIEVPQDRDGSFEPKVVQKRQKDISGIEQKIISLYAKGMTTRQISETIEDIYGFEVSDGMVSDITDRLLPQIEEWRKGYSCDMCRRAFRNERSSSCCISADRITALYCSLGQKYVEICWRKNKKEFADAPQNILISLRCAPLHQDILHRWLDKRQYSIYTEKGKRATDQPLSAQSHFSAVDCFYRDFFAEPKFMSNHPQCRYFIGQFSAYIIISRLNYMAFRGCL